jgi:hypothetical protein
MQLISDGSQGPTAIPAKLPPSGVPGYAQPYLPGIVQPTIWGPDIANTIIAELVNLVTALGYPLNPADNSQVVETVKLMASGYNTHLTSSATLQPNQAGFVSMDASGGSFGITLAPANQAHGSPFRFQFARYDGTQNTVTLSISGGGSFLPGGQSSITLSGYSVVNVQSDGANYFIQDPNEFPAGLTASGWDSGGASVRLLAPGGNIGALLRVDAANLYLLLTNPGSPRGSYNGLRPIQISLSTGAITLDGTGAGLNTGGSIGVAGNVNASGSVNGSSLYSSGDVNAAGNVNANGAVSGAYVGSTGNINAAGTFTGGNVNVTNEIQGGFGRLASGAYGSGDGGRIVTLSDYQAAPGPNGVWVRFPSGIIIQCGYNSSTNANFQFPEAFPSGCFSFICGNADAQGSWVDNAFGYAIDRANYYCGTKESNQPTPGSVSNFPVSWIAMGD